MFILIVHESCATTRGDTDRLCLHYFLRDPWAIPQKLSLFIFIVIITLKHGLTTGQTTLGDLQEGPRPKVALYTYMQAWLQLRNV
jgi:hypothetical protein